MEALHQRTPLIHSVPLSSHLGKPVYLKIESMQASGSFKDRGAGHVCAYYAKQGARCFVTSSGGNAGMAIATMGRKLGIPVKVVVPSSTNSLMRTKIAAIGAEVTVYGDSWDDADPLARQWAKEEGVAYIPSFDHPLIWEGISSLVDEVLEAGVRPGAWVLSVGGGGLFCGVMQGLARHGQSSTPVITAETQGASSLAQSVEAGRLVTLDTIDTVATTLGARRVAKQALTHALNGPVFPQVLSDHQVIQAILHFADDHRLLVEPACGAALAVVYENLSILEAAESVLVVCCGGNGVNRKLFDMWEQRFTTHAIK